MYSSTSGNLGIGINDAKGFSWLNGQIKANEPGTTFYYAYINDTSYAPFRDRVINDITVWRYPLYVAVNVQSPSYVWYQDTPATHATAGAGYASSGAQVTIGDPFTSPSYYPYCSQNVHNPGYSSSPDTGCTYSNFDTQRYYAAKQYEYW